MKIIIRLREQVFKNWKNRPEIIYLDEYDFEKYWSEVKGKPWLPKERPNQLWFSGIPVVREGDKRIFREIVHEAYLVNIRKK